MKIPDDHWIVNSINPTAAFIPYNGDKKYRICNSKDSQISVIVSIGAGDRILHPNECHDFIANKIEIKVNGNGLAHGTCKLIS